LTELEKRLILLLHQIYLKKGIDMSIKSKNHLVYSYSYPSDLSVLGTSVSFGKDRGARILEQLSADYDNAAAYTKPRMLPDKQLQLAHTANYLKSLKVPQTWADIFDLQSALPQTPATRKILSALLSQYKLKCGGTLSAARKALRYSLAANLGGGFHHAHADRGDGFCVLNDIAITIKTLQAEKKVKNVLIVDTDFHHGNGNASIFANDHSVFILDVYSKEAWPPIKEPCSLPVPVAIDQSALYLGKLTDALHNALKRFKPDLVIFVQGADTWEHGVLNGGEGFSLPLATVQAKDKFVIDTIADRGIPLMMVLAGGFGENAWQGHYHGIQHLLARAGATVV